MQKIARSFALATVVGLTLLSPGFTQNQASMERMLNYLDRPGAWSNVPVSGAQPQVRQPINSAPTDGRAATPMRQTMFNSSGFAANAAPVLPMAGQGSNPFAAQGGNNLFSRENILKTLFGGSPSTGGGSSHNDPAKSANAQDNLSTALDRAAKAEADCERASSGNDKNSRLAAAESARYAAGAARAAAERAESAAYGGNSYASGLAAQARDAANRAQAAADRATANAENFTGNGGGW